MTAARITETPDFDNPMLPANVHNPFPLYAWLRENSPVHRSEHLNSWMLSRYADVRAAFGDPKRFSSQAGASILVAADRLPAEARDDFKLGYRFFFEQLQATDAPAHTVQRALITKAFSARVLENVRDRIQRRVHVLIDDMERKKLSDFVADFAYPLPSLVIFDLLGVPESHYEDLRQSAAAFAQFLPAVFTGNVAAIRQIGEKLRRTDAQLRSLIGERRRDPQTDLISSLAAVRDQDANLSEDSIVILCNFLLFAGHETTANLLGGSLLHLLRNRELYEESKNRTNSLANVVEELLRFVSPVISVARIATEDIEMHRQVIPKGQRVSLLVASANHDPSQFEDPDTVKLDRERVQAVAFGHGIHYCVGALLARMETELALKALLTRLPQIKLASEEVEYQPVFFLRALKALPVYTS